MKRSIRYMAALLVGLLSLAGAHFDVQAQTPRQVFDRLKERYAGIESVQARFTQAISSDYSDETMTARGTVVMQGNKYRVETDAQTLVTNGEITWVYMPADRQVLINDYVADETTFSLNDFFFHQADRYDATDVKTVQVSGAKHFVLTLKPKDDTSFTEAVIYMRDSDALVTRLQVTDINGTRMDFTLEDLRINPSLDRTVFTFTPPPGAEIVDLRSR